MVELGSLDSSHNLQANYTINFLFCLDLILYECKILVWCDSFGILNFTSKQRGIYEALAGDSCALENAGAYIKLAGNNAHRNLIYSWVVSCYVPIKF